MGSGDNNNNKQYFLSFHLHLHHHHHHHHFDHHQEQEQEQIMKKDQEHMSSTVPKGYMAIMVGHEGEEQKRFVIPVMYIYHPLFLELLKVAEEEYGFDHQGPINIPCNVQEFCNVQGLIDKDNYFKGHHHHHQHHHHHPHLWCFKAKA